MTTTAIDRGLGAELAEDLAATAFTLAKRFAAGATMWSIAPSWEPHALHIAVEFVHPVIVGKRALPAIALTGDPHEVAESIDLLAMPDDIVIAFETPAAALAVAVTRARSLGALTVGFAPLGVEWELVP